MDLKC